MKSVLMDVYQTANGSLTQTMVDMDWENPAVYAAWLAQTYHFVSQSTRLIGFNGSLFLAKDNHLHARFLSHSAEEANHERLAVQDMKKLGFNIEQFPELPVTAAFWQSQIYNSMFQGPFTFFGYLFCLEGLAVTAGKSVHDRVRKAHSEAACNFVRVHAEEDIDHLDKAFELVQTASDAEMMNVCNNLKKSCGLYETMLQQVARAGARKDLLKAG